MIPIPGRIGHLEWKDVPPAFPRIDGPSYSILTHTEVCPKGPDIHIINPYINIKLCDRIAVLFHLAVFSNSHNLDNLSVGLPFPWFSIRYKTISYMMFPTDPSYLHLLHLVGFIPPCCRPVCWRDPHRCQIKSYHFKSLNTYVHFQKKLLDQCLGHLIDST